MEADLFELELGLDKQERIHFVLLELSIVKCGVVEDQSSNLIDPIYLSAASPETILSQKWLDVASL